MRERNTLRLILIAALALLPSLASMAAAQEVATPNFWDQRQRITKPPLPQDLRIRFLTSVDYPPFNFLDARGRLAGFNVDLVREICEELAMIDRCQIEARPFAELLPALNRGEADAIVAGLAMTPSVREEVAFTQPYLRYPARFVARRNSGLAEPLAISGRKIGVVEGSAHAAMLRSFFPAAVPVGFATIQLAAEALKRGEVDAMFGDGFSLSFWLTSNVAEDCCEFVGGPYLSDRFLGEGLAIAVAKDKAAMARGLDYAIGQIVADGRFTELLLRYFPVSAF